MTTNRESEVISVKVRIKRSKSIVVADFYRPPNESSNEHAQTVLDEHARLRQEHNKCKFWISGDFNFPDIDLPTLAVKSNQYSAAMSSTYLNIRGLCGVEQLVEIPTRGNKILDLFFTSHPSQVSRCKPIPGIGYHDAVLVDTLNHKGRSPCVERYTYGTRQT